MPRKKPSVIFKSSPEPLSDMRVREGEPILVSPKITIQPIEAEETGPSQTMKQKRHEIYDWLVSIGCPGMEQGGKWRGYLKDKLVEYAELTSGVYKHQLKGFMKEAERKAEQRRKSLDGLKKKNAK